MIIRPAASTDAADIAALVRKYDSSLVVEPELAAPYFESMSEQAHLVNLASARFAYSVAQDERDFVGYIAMRDGSHLFNLFVQPAWLRRGVAKALWVHALAQLPRSSGSVTVNAALSAVPVYKALGFSEVGAIIRQHGIAFVPMLYQR